MIQIQCRKCGHLIHFPRAKTEKQACSFARSEGWVIKSGGNVCDKCKEEGVINDGILA